MLPALVLLAGVGVTSAASPYSIDTEADLKQSASTLAYDLLSYYNGNQSGMTIGILPGPPPNGDYYWWEAGAMWGTMIDYWHYTGDTTYNDVTTQAMLWQTGDDNNYMPNNWTASLGNDDQGFWGMSAMLAAEVNFPNPPSKDPQWLELAQAVWNTQAVRPDDTCGGGLRWQIPLTNNGYDYKNSIANGIFFNMGARLARYTGNDTYAQEAIKTWDWITSVGLMDADYNVWDGAHVEDNCTDINKQQYSYSNAVWLQGAAFMYNYTNGSAEWETRINGLMKTALGTFFPNNIAFEVQCEQSVTCTADMLSYKGYSHRWFAVVTQIAPFTATTLLPVLKTSATAAINQCTGGTTGRQCGFAWSSGTFDGLVGAGQQMDVLAAVLGQMVGTASAPYTNATGGTSQGNVNAGQGTGVIGALKPITTGDRAGAGILTTLILAGAVGAFTWMSIGD